MSGSQERARIGADLHQQSSCHRSKWTHSCHRGLPPADSKCSLIYLEDISWAAPPIGCSSHHFGTTVLTGDGRDRIRLTASLAVVDLNILF